MARGIVGVLLAAGASRRFGGDKLMHPLSDDKPMALASAERLRPACDHVVAVLRPEQQALADLLSTRGWQIALCPEAKMGMGHSLAAGVAATPDASGWIIALGDMPFIASDTHRTVSEHLRAGACLVATQYQEQRGHPVGFGQKWLPDLTALNGEQGGQAILRQYRQRLVLVSVEDPGVIRDIDYRADLEDLALSGP
jgi:molybdenum cofactor cytidylyltransferase